MGTVTAIGDGPGFPEGFQGAGPMFAAVPRGTGGWGWPRAGSPRTRWTGTAQTAPRTGARSWTGTMPSRPPTPAAAATSTGTTA